MGRFTRPVEYEDDSDLSPEEVAAKRKALQIIIAEVKNNLGDLIDREESLGRGRIYRAGIARTPQGYVTKHQREFRKTLAAEMEDLESRGVLEKFRKEYAEKKERRKREKEEEEKGRADEKARAKRQYDHDDLDEFRVSARRKAEEETRKRQAVGQREANRASKVRTLIDKINNTMTKADPLYQEFRTRPAMTKTEDTELKTAMRNATERFSLVLNGQNPGDPEEKKGRKQ